MDTKTTVFKVMDIISNHQDSLILITMSRNWFDYLYHQIVASYGKQSISSSSDMIKFYPTILLNTSIVVQLIDRDTTSVLYDVVEGDEEMLVAI